MFTLKHLIKPPLTKGFVQNVLTRCLFSQKGSGSKKYYDIIIAGGGMIGTTLACTLGKNTRLSGKRILLLESSKDSLYVLPEKYSNRVVSLNPGTKKSLTKIDAWKHINEARFATVKRLQLMDALSDASITFGEESSDKDISYIVENNLIIDAVKKEIKTTNNVEICYERKIKKYLIPGIEDNHVHIILENGDEYSCDILIGCDGVNSQVRNAMGVHYLNWKYDNTGVVATLTFSEEFDNCIAWQRWLPTGPIALLPLNNSQSSLVWSTIPADAKKLLQLTNEQFVDAVNEAIWKVFKHNSYVDQVLKTFDGFLRVSNCSPGLNRRYPPKIVCVEEGSRNMFPLGFGHAASYVAKGVALVGDAAHRVHPLAGQGVNLGFGDITCLDNVLGEAAYSGSCLGNVNYLKVYETKRQRHNMSMMAGIEGLYRIYRSDLTPLVLLRSLGLQTIDVLNPVKKMVINHAST
ncbi:ubiquinone biosynthesis monooxygenase COQ6, mitochondrial isoform X1 [Diorhabda sublineata]|uniref:ubiquinone biosynthesis monooxygenase COQ6, mitochondrial isoform X1 n=1 Tax=Diorhabda sublineata TaxID=1163346 RepID=UPI0024E0A89F|nr:ubiquinone biosynthesis monooxygenase COQ6, mitochondrial isoform X1 [Diorhabda sublineata]XP_056635327.1 ubiquinone biosynthesis monooxygenase COQ6, mitochondrial isoform X1 [Diorhabda sublineata]